LSYNELIFEDVVAKALLFYISKIANSLP